MPRDQVLNHVLFGRGSLKPGPMEGYLLGIGNSKPDNLIAGGWIEFTLAIIGYDHNEYAEIITLWVDSLSKGLHKASREIYREGLYANESTRNRGYQDLGIIGQSPARNLPARHQIAERRS